MFVVLFDTNLDARVVRQWRRACGVVDTNLDARVFRQWHRVCGVVGTNLDARVFRQPSLLFLRYSLGPDCAQNGPVLALCEE